MEINLSKALGAVRVALGETAQKAQSRRLMVYPTEIKCLPKCDSCCARLITISIAEAFIIYEHLLREDKWEEVRERAVTIFKTSQEASPLSWFKMNVKCPVLDQETKLCKAYGSRPAICSTHFVSSDPAGCDPWATRDVPYESASMHDLFNEFQEELSRKVPQDGIMSMVVHLPVALLIAERINKKTTLSVQDTISLLYNELK